MRFCLSPCFSQHKEIDSLKKVLHGFKNDTNKVNVLNDLAWRLQKIGNYETSFQYLDTAETLAEKINYKSGLSITYNVVGVIYANEGNYPAALKNHFLALKLREELGDKKGIASSLNNIGTVYRLEGNHYEAIKSYFLALKIGESINDKAGIAANYNNLGLVYFSQQNFPKALKCYLQSLKLKEELGNKRGCANSYNNIGLVYSNRGNYIEAMKNFSISLNIMEEFDNKYGIETACSNMATIFIKQKKYKEASVYGNKALEIATEIGDVAGIKEANFCLSQLNEALGDSKKSLQYYKAYVKNKDSLINEDKTKEIIKLQMNYEFDKKESEALLAHELREKMLIEEGKRQGVFNLVIISLLILVSVSTFIIYKRYKIINKQKETIEHLLKEIHHRVKNNLQVISSILNLQKGYIDDEKNREVFQDCQNRIYAMAAIHEKLYTKAALTNINLQDYITTLISQLIDTYKVKYPIKQEVEVNVGGLKLDTLITVGLITNEIISNSIKYAFNNAEDNLVFFKLSKNISTSIYTLTIGDNGKGIGFNFFEAQPSFGVELIKVLVEQLDGKIVHHQDLKGTVYEITFSVQASDK
ncbi:MAG: tetratricopeptide repeat protein [Bacteroidia bacterium]|nr:tetratricopeptide repeat protein [Bacteroidia bacterium]